MFSTSAAAERVRDMGHRAHGRGNLVWGVALIVLGGVLLLDRLRVIDIGDFWRLWPLVVIYFGLTQLVAPRDGKRSAWLFLAGVWLLVSSFEVFGFNYENSWPLLIMLAGVSMLFDHRYGRRRVSQPRSGDDVPST